MSNKFRTYSNSEEKIYKIIEDIKAELDDIEFVKVVCDEFPEEEWIAFATTTDEKIFSDIQNGLSNITLAFEVDDKTYL